MIFANENSKSAGEANHDGTPKTDDTLDPDDGPDTDE